MDSLPPGKTTPKAGSLFMGQPFDPLLAAAFERFGMLMQGLWHTQDMKVLTSRPGLG